MPFFQPNDIVLRDYKIETFIGEGGFGEVYRALDLNLNEMVALKILRRATALEGAYYERARQRFMLEARLGLRISHPNVIRIYKFAPDESSGLLGLAMEFASGGSLADRLQAGELSIAEALGFARAIAAGLSALHAEDVVHRDIKPSNILLDGSGGVRVADLGLAQAANAPQGSLSISGAGGEMWMAPGTPAYMSPEQERGKPHLPPASDIYALGLVLFEMLTRRTYKNQPPGSRASDLRPDLPPEVDDLLAAMLADDPRQRPWNGTAAEKALTALIALVAGAAPIPAQSAPEPAPALPTPPPTSPAWSIGDGLAALRVMMGANEWRLAVELLEQLETAYPGNPQLLLPRKQLDQAVAEQQQRELQAKRAAEARNRAQLDEIAKRQNDLAAAEKARQESRLRRRDGHLVIILDGGQELVFKRIPAGEFRMGSDPQVDSLADPDELPIHTVLLGEYWIGLTPVTNAQYAAFVLAGGGKPPRHWEDGRCPAKKLDHPVVHVNWHEAVSYCAWLSRLTGQKLFLPTEAQWEKAARGLDGRIYPWGNQQPDSKRCNYNGRAKGTTPVGRYTPAGDSPFGCLDMAGNVWEWCADWYGGDYYPGSPQADPPGANSGTCRVLRGGSWDGPDKYLRCADRTRDIPDSRIGSQGFRCAMVMTSR